MPLPSGVGVNIVCYRGDYPFAKACCASVRDQLGSAPIDLFVDGDFPTSELEKVYGVRPVHRRDIADERLRARSFGYGLTKLVLFWESRFERFVYLDADTVMWGNPFADLALDGADVIHNTPHEPYTDFILKSQYFDPDRLFEHTRRFDWQGRHYFNTGVFVGRRGLFAIDEYLQLLDVRDRDASLLGAGDQGIFNVLVYRGVAEGRLTVHEAPLQTVLPVVPPAEQRRRFRVGDGRPCIDPGDRTVLHWAGPDKPFYLRSDVHTAPMTHYRKQFLRHGRHPLRFAPAAALVAEDLRADRRQALPVALRTTIRRARQRLRG
jgi:hypothetical protein